MHENRGHAAIGAERFAEENAEWLAFIADRIGLVTASAEASKAGVAEVAG